MRESTNQIKMTVDEESLKKIRAQFEKILASNTGVIILDDLEGGLAAAIRCHSKMDVYKFLGHLLVEMEITDRELLVLFELTTKIRAAHGEPTVHEHTHSS